MSDFKITTCPICKKRFLPTLYWVYMLKRYSKEGYKTTYYCSYSCYREAGGGKEKSKNTPKKRGKLYT